MSFKSDVRKFGKKVETDLGLVVKETGFKLLSMTMELTPVDFGRARASWNISLNKIDPSVKPPGSYTFHINFGAIREVTKKDVIFISNNLEYIEALERGHSQQQAPKGMLNIAVRNFRRFMKESVKNVNR